jgi:hypothetical protein
VENPYQAPASEPPPLPLPTTRGLLPVRTLASAALWMYVGSSVLAVVDHLVRAFALPQARNLHNTEWIMIILGLGSMVPYLIWKYRVTWNATLISPAGMTVSPAMAVGSYFIPIANFFLPFKAMAQVARATTGTTRGVALWWATQLGGMLLGLVIGVVQGTNSPAVPGMLDHLYIALSVPSVFAAWRLMMDITRAQTAGMQGPA